MPQYSCRLHSVPYSSFKTCTNFTISQNLAIRSHKNFNLQKPHIQLKGMALHNNYMTITDSRLWKPNTVLKSLFQHTESSLINEACKSRAPILYVNNCTCCIKYWAKKWTFERIIFKISFYVTDNCLHHDFKVNVDLLFELKCRTCKTKYLELISIPNFKILPSYLYY